MTDLSKETIEELFIEQIRELTFKTNRALRTIEMQFSDIIL